MITILINAYACGPNMGSEPGMAWKWIIHLANHCKLHVITEGEWKTEIELALKELPQAENIKFYYNPVTTRIRNMCWNQGDWRFYYHYRKWQKNTLQIASQIISEHHIDIIHQLNMIGFREPGYLWQIKDKPFIWGPFNAKVSFPKSYLKGTNIKVKLFFVIKSFISKLQLSTSKRVKNAMISARFLIGASSDSVHSVQKYHNLSPVLLNESGCELPQKKMVTKTISNKTLHLLWVGRFIFTKQLDLALQTISKLKELDILIHIVGGNPHEEEQQKNRASKLGITNLCKWHGKVLHSKVQELMQQCDLFFFTSIAEGTPHVVLESISNQLPILCFDTCGQGDSVNDKIGLKIALSTPQRSVSEFAKIIAHLFYNRNELKSMASNCRERQTELSWDNKAQQMISFYKQALDDFKEHKM